MLNNSFELRHIGPRPHDIEKITQKIGVSSVEELINQTIPKDIRLDKELDLPDGLNEYEYINHLKKIASKNRIFRTYIGMGYYNTITPGVITRNILENPGWYTAYTPYQAEISQGRLEALLNFQTLICELTAMEISNASLLDEGTAAAEAMIMLFNSRGKDLVKKGAIKFFVSEKCFPQTLAVLKNRALPLGIVLVIGNHETIKLDHSYYGVMVQYPDEKGSINDYNLLTARAKELQIKVVVAADLLSLALLTPPGEWGADVVVGTSQRFGIPLGYGGPHAGYFATSGEFKRHIPGRIIGVSMDKTGTRALRMALQTREQHIKREKATSNICTAQALLAIMAGMFAVYHGPGGLTSIARHIHSLTLFLSNELKKIGFRQLNKDFFDTILIELPKNISSHLIRELTVANEMNFRIIDENYIGISLDETTTLDNVDSILEIFAQATNNTHIPIDKNIPYCEYQPSISEQFIRKSEFLKQPVFNKYHSETELMRYMKKLENRDLALNRTMIPLGSCTMKLNSATQLFHLSWPEFANLHPFVPACQAEGYHEIIRSLEQYLCEITGFDAVTFMPNSGAAGEYTGLMIIRAYHESRGQGHRDITLIPSSAHGTNPSSAVLAGTKVVVVNCDEMGNIDINDLENKARQNSHNLAAIMITYPSTHGVFEDNILKVTNIVHRCGGLVYMDGANMNAQVGLTNPAICGADVCHLNLHKTFAIPHGGGGPGAGPICVSAKLAKFLPSHPIIKTGVHQGIHPVASAPFGNAFILPITYGYIRLLGRKGLVNATKMAILNANYLKSSLEGHFNVLYAGHNNRTAHEFIIDCNPFKRRANIDAVDIAKRLMDYGFHAPTVAFPVIGTLMIEPTESESIQELDRFVEAMLSIRDEISEIESGKSGLSDNLLKNAPHTANMAVCDNWTFAYTRQKAVFPLSWLHEMKYFAPVTRIDEALGDRNLVCTCPPMDSYN